MKDHHFKKSFNPIGMVLAIHWRLCILRIGIFLWIFCANLPAQASELADMHNPHNLDLGRHLFRKGEFGPASLLFQKAASQFESQHQVSEQITALIYQAQALQQMGQFFHAQKTLIAAYQLTRQLDSPILRSKILGRMGVVHFLRGRNSLAHHFLCRAIDLAEPTTDTHLKAGLYNDMGNVLFADKKLSQAMGRYKKSFEMAEATGERALAVSALTNFAQAALENRQVAQAKEKLLRAYNQALQLVPTQTKIDGLLNIGLGFEDLEAVPEHSTRNISGLQILSDQKNEMQEHALHVRNRLVQGEIAQEEYEFGKSRYDEFTRAWDRWIWQLDQALQEERNPECSDDYQVAFQKAVHTREEFLEFLSQNSSRELRGPLGIILREGVKILTDAAYKLVITPSTVIAAESATTPASSTDKKDDPEKAERSLQLDPLYYESKNVSQ